MKERNIRALKTIYQRLPPPRNLVTSLQGFIRSREPILPSCGGAPLTPIKTEVNPKHMKKNKAGTFTWASESH